MKNEKHWDKIGVIGAAFSTTELVFGIGRRLSEKSLAKIHKAPEAVHVSNSEELLAAFSKEQGKIIIVEEGGLSPQVMDYFGLHCQEPLIFNEYKPDPILMDKEWLNETKFFKEPDNFINGGRKLPRKKKKK